MTRETKVGLLVGLGIILLIGIIVSDHLSVAHKQGAANLTHFVDLARRRIRARPTKTRPSPTIRTRTTLSHRPKAAGSKHTTPLPLPANASPQKTAKPQPRFAPQPSKPNNDRMAARHRETPVLTLSQTRAKQSPAAQSVLPVESAKYRASLRGSRVAGRRATTGDLQPVIHYVGEGESLWVIAQRYYGNGDYWRSIARANPKAVKPDGNVRVGVRLVIPNKAGLADQSGRLAEKTAVKKSNRSSDRARGSAGSPRSYTVVPNDSLWVIAEKMLGDPNRWEEIFEANRKQLKHPEALQAGQRLKIPAR